MKKKFNIALIISFVTATGIFSSCDLDLMPLNEVVLENFWENKSEVQNVLDASYAAMMDEYITKAIIWGECRSDNITAGEGVTSCAGLQQLLKGQLKSTNEACNWSSIYKVINYCNTVLYYAPEVKEKDPNFTDSDLQATQAEAKALRAISYMLLIKTFGNVPFTAQPSIDDTQNYLLPASPGDSIVDVLIQDIEEVKDWAPKKHAEDYKKCTGRITRQAMYSILADLYLWRASDKNFSRQQEYYQKAIECCDWVIKYKLGEYEANEGQGHWKKEDFDKYVYQHYGYPLLAEEVNPGTNDGGPKAYNKIFGEGNSFEGIFELTYEAGTTKTTNSAVCNMYGGNSNGSRVTPYVSASEYMLPDPLTTSSKTYSQQTETTPFSVLTDYRSITNFVYTDNGKYDILKYTLNGSSNVGGGNRNGSVGNQWAAATDVTKRSDSETTENWIFYRLTDIMLMRAEAEVCLARIINGTDDATPKNYTETRRYGADLFGQDSLLYNDAFNLVRAVYMRSNPVAQNVTTAAPTRESMTTYGDFITLIEMERRRELMFEGKRMFDLVRRARREGTTSHFAQMVSAKYGEASRAVLIKMSMMEFMYMPYAKDQIKINPYLKQNPAYDEEEDYKKL